MTPAEWSANGVPSVVAGATRCATKRQYCISPVLGGLDLLRSPGAVNRIPSFGRDTLAIGTLLSGEASFARFPYLPALSHGSLLVIPPSISLHALRLQGNGGDLLAIGGITAAVAQLLRQCHPFHELLGERPRVLPAPDLVGELIALHGRLTRDLTNDRLDDELVDFLAAVGERSGPQGPMLGSAAQVPCGVAHVRKLIDREPFRRWSVCQMSVVAEMRFHSFAHAFTDAIGVSPHSYALQRRLEASKLLLRSGESVSRVAHQLGFADQSHFTRRFVAVFGVTPGEYQRAWRVFRRDERKALSERRASPQPTRRVSTHPAQLMHANSTTSAVATAFFLEP